MKLTIQVRHIRFGDLIAVDARITGSNNRVLVCRPSLRNFSSQRLLLLDSQYWLDPEAARQAFHKLYVIRRERELRRSRHDYAIDAAKARRQHPRLAAVDDDYGQFSTQVVEADDVPAPVEALDMDAQPDLEVSLADIGRLLGRTSPADLLAGRILQ